VVCSQDNDRQNRLDIVVVEVLAMLYMMDSFQQFQLDILELELLVVVLVCSNLVGIQEFLVDTLVLVL